MNLKLLYGWIIVGEANNFQLIKPGASRKGRPINITHGWYSMLGHALESFVELALRASDAKTLKEVQDTISRIESLKSQFRGLKQ